jgi:(p)ppGpp synthase/HD superfamily hydrolase
MAEHYHQGQTRWDGEPYFKHCERVYKLLQTIGAPVHVQIAGILHDVLEDTSCEERTILDEFGPAVLSLVKQCSKKADGSFELKDPEAWMIKLCDGFDNCTDLEAVKEPRIRSYAKTKRQLFGIS